MNSNCLKKKVNRILINPDADTICVGKKKRKGKVKEMNLRNHLFSVLLMAFGLKRDEGMMMMAFCSFSELQRATCRNLVVYLRGEKK